MLKAGVFVFPNIKASEFRRFFTTGLSFFAIRFAPKESISKSLGTGIRDDLNFKDIEILNDKLGKPYFRKTKKINNLIYKKFKVKKYNLYLSISDEKDYSIAFTIIQKQ